MTRISAIAAIGAHRALGKENQLLWRIPDDLKRFRALTRGHPVVMGRKTFDSIVAALGKPLPDRSNIVITRDTAWRHEGVHVAHSVEEGIESGRRLDQEDVFIIGGAQVYEAALPHTDKLYLTLIEDEKEADAFFPPYEREFTRTVANETHDWQGITYHWIDLERAPACLGGGSSA